MSNDERRIEVDAADVETETPLGIIARAEIDSAIATARSYPRSLKTFVGELCDMATMDEETAAACIYALPRAGKSIEGPSAKFAALVGSAWGHGVADGEGLGVIGDFVMARGTYKDLQRNWTVRRTVKRRVTNRNGQLYDTDMIGVTESAAVAIAIRNATLSGIPQVFWMPAYKAARKVVAGGSETLANRRAKAIEYLQKLGIRLDMVIATLQKEEPQIQGIEDITSDHLVTLKAVARQIKDGETTVEDAFIDPKAKSSAPAATAGKPGVGVDALRTAVESGEPVVSSGSAEPQGEMPLAGSQAQPKAGSDVSVIEALEEARKSIGAMPAAMTKLMADSNGDAAAALATVQVLMEGARMINITDDELRAIVKKHVDVQAAIVEINKRADTKTQR